MPCRKFIEAICAHAAGGKAPNEPASTKRPLPKSRMFLSVTPKAPLLRNELALLKRPAGPPLSQKTTNVGRSAGLCAEVLSKVPRAKLPANAAPPWMIVRREIVCSVIYPSAHRASLIDCLTFKRGG